MSSTDPSVHCDCRAKSIRNTRIVTAAIFLCALVLSAAAFDEEPVVDAACAFVASLALCVYGVATALDETATFPKWLYIGLALVGAGFAVHNGASLFF